MAIDRKSKSTVTRRTVDGDDHLGPYRELQEQKRIKEYDLNRPVNSAKS